MSITPCQGGVISTPAVAQTSSQAPTQKLLPELVDHVIDHLHDDIASLAACALVGREWTTTARFHRFSTLKVHLQHDNYAMLGEVLSSTPEIRSLVRELWIAAPWGDDPPDPALPNMGLLTWLPVMEATEEVVLAGYVLERDGDYDYDLSPYLPSLKRLGIHKCRFGVGVLDIMLRSFPHIDTLRLLSVARLLREPRPPRSSGSIMMPPVHLRELDVSAYDTPAYVLRHASEWMLRHPSAELLQTLRFQSTFYCTHEAQPMLDLFGPLNLNALYIGISAYVQPYYRDKFDVSPQTTASLERCANLRVLSVTIQMYDLEQEWPPVLLCVQLILQSLASPALETLIIATRGYLGKPIPIEIIQELDWKAIQTALQGKPLPNLRSIIIRGKGDLNELTATLKEKCPELYMRGLFKFASLPSQLEYDLRT